MNYSKIYTEFIANRRENPAIGYTEKHHIVPCHMGGSDGAENIVALSAYDHYFAHLIYAKWKNTSKAWYSVKAMMDMPGSSKKRLSCTMDGAMYEYARIHMSKAASDKAKLQHMDAEYRAIMCSAEVNAKRSASLKGRISPMKGKKQSEETKRKKEMGITAYWESETGCDVKREKSKSWKKNNPNDNPESAAKITAGIKAYRAKPEIKEMYSRTRMGKNNPMYGKQGWNKGVPMSEEAKAKLSASMKGKPGWNKGISMSEEAKAHLSRINTGKTLSAETREKISAGCKGKGGRKVVCKETGESFNTARLAGLWAGLSDGSEVGKSCRRPEKRAGGYHWKYAGVAR